MNEYLLFYMKKDYSEPSKEELCKDLKEVQISMSENLNNDFILVKMLIANY
ncbi:hypothetical protein vBBcePLY3_00024 [Bacillus phage vB_BceP_LY3]|uniref:Uncharacterized protein n=1 Tax=Bacillus phage vB_BceP_LY3 TaxID=2950458 RepID=A0AAE9LW80_9CAUD|nr:hypothetical protein vBBcePLY3_00024 [Bacillus phage vB_BceP_LY3]